VVEVRREEESEREGRGEAMVDIALLLFVVRPLVRRDS